MNFSNTFKKVYWWVLLIVLTLLGIWRICVRNFLTFDLYLFVSWFIIVLFPIISEISVFGLNVKKDIESAKNELKGQLADIKNSINNNQNQTVHIHTVPADKNEIEQKQKEEVTEEAKRLKDISDKSNLSLSPNTEIKKIGSSEKALERHVRMEKIEKLVNEYLTKLHGANYQAQIKIADANSDKKIITDGVVFKEDKKISEIIEIKTISVKGLEAFYFVASRFIQKLQKLGLRNAVRFIVVSEVMDQEIAQSVIKQVHQIRFTKVVGASVPSIRTNFFRLENDELEEVIIE